MQNMKRVFTELKQKYDEQTGGKKTPKIHWHSIPDSLAESYTADYAGGIITVKAQGYPGAIFALKRMEAGILSGHLADFLGPTEPHFKIRPLWLDETTKNMISNPHHIHSFCKKIWELGYNSIVVDHSPITTGLSSFCRSLCDYGLKVILKASCPFKSNYRRVVSDYFKQMNTQDLYFDFIFWESQWQHPELMNDPHVKDMTFQELALAEARLIENQLPSSKKLIFYLPVHHLTMANQCSEWMLDLANDLQKETILAFSAVAGDVFADFLPTHPLWNKLRLQVKSSSAALMPLLNVGNVKQNEGLAPILVQDLLDDYLSRHHTGNFAGVLCLANHLPAGNGIHECNLWMASQMMLRPTFSSLLADTWFSAYRPDWNYSFYSPVLHQIRSLSKQINRLRFFSQEENRHQMTSQECRCFVESILSQLNEIHLKLEKEERKKIKKSQKTTLEDYFIYFAFDSKKILLHILQCFNISITHLNENDIKESFWTELNRAGLSQSKVTFLSSPNKGSAGSKMQLIYQENRLTP